MIYNYIGDSMQHYFAVNEKLELDEKDIHHIINVMRMKKNDRFNIIYNNTIYECNIENIKKDNFDYKIIKEKKYDIKNIVNISIAIPLLKEQKFDIVLQKATELGVHEIIPIVTERTLIKLNERDFQKKLDRWSRICKEASEQSHRLYIPKISSVKTIDDLINNKLELNIFCNVNETSKSIKGIFKDNNNCDKLLVVVGPEGGFTNKEIEKLSNNNFISVTLGDNVLRTETVPLYILSVANYEYNL